MSPAIYQDRCEVECESRISTCFAEQVPKAFKTVKCWKTLNSINPKP